MPRRLRGFRAEIAQLCAKHEFTSSRCHQFRQGHEALRLRLGIQVEVGFTPVEPKPKNSSLVFRRQYNPDQQIPQKL